MRLLAFAANVIVALAILGTIAILRQIGPDIEARLFPVLSDQVPTVERFGDEVEFTVLLRKNRTCRIASLSWQIADDDAKNAARAPITVRQATTGTEVSPQAVYPPGIFRNGPFDATLPPSFSGADQIIGNIEYSCHPFWTTPQVYGPFPIPPPA